MVCEPALAFCAREIELGEYLLLGKGEDATGGRKRESVTSDAMEALIGAIYVDGGFANAKEFINRFILKDLENKKLFYDSKTILQEIVQAHYKEELFIIIWLEKRDRITIKLFRSNVRLARQVLWKRKRTYKKERQNRKLPIRHHSDAPEKEYKVGVVCI